MFRTVTSILDHDPLKRRGFLKITGVATAAAVLSTATGRLLHAAALTQARRDKLTPDDIIAMMKAGNERFRLGKESPHDFLAQQKASGQRKTMVSLMRWRERTSS